MKTSRRPLLDTILNPSGMAATVRNNEVRVQKIERAPVKFNVNKPNPPKKAPNVSTKGITVQFTVDPALLNAHVGYYNPDESLDDPWLLTEDDNYGTGLFIVIKQTSTPRIGGAQPYDTADLPIPTIDGFTLVKTVQFQRDVDNVVDEGHDHDSRLSVFAKIGSNEPFVDLAITGWHNSHLWDSPDTLDPSWATDITVAVISGDVTGILGSDSAVLPFASTAETSLDIPHVAGAKALVFTFGGLYEDSMSAITSVLDSGQSNGMTYLGVAHSRGSSGWGIYSWYDAARVDGRALIVTPKPVGTLPSDQGAALAAIVVGYK